MAKPRNAPEVITTLEASAVRRIFAYGAALAFGSLLILLAFAQPPAFGWQLFLLALGVSVLVVAERLRRVTQLGLVLTDQDLRDTSGHVLTTLANIKSVDRGTFAFKPSNGFILRLRKENGRIWAPGMWWQLSTRIGVGGATQSGAAKYMAEQIALRISDNAT